jgi:diguanylate cyclase (GGDEF)-like protein
MIFAHSFAGYNHHLQRRYSMGMRLAKKANSKGFLPTDPAIAAHFTVPMPVTAWPQHRPSTMHEADQLLAMAEQTIASQQQRIEQLENLALTDELTGLINRRGLMQALQHELAAVNRDAEAVGLLILCDLNGFKLVNDTHGHVAGDAYLRAVAKALQADVRPSDVVARIGGDEFALLLKRIDLPQAQARLERLDHVFHTQALTWHGQVLPLAGSFGSAAYGVGDHPEALMHTADMRLYAQKAQRKGRA